MKGNTNEDCQKKIGKEKKSSKERVNSGEK